MVTKSLTFTFDANDIDAEDIYSAVDTCLTNSYCREQTLARVILDLFGQYYNGFEDDTPHVSLEYARTLIGAVRSIVREHEEVLFPASEDDPANCVQPVSHSTQKD